METQIITVSNSVLASSSQKTSPHEGTASMRMKSFQKKKQDSADPSGHKIRHTLRRKVKNYYFFPSVTFANIRGFNSNLIKILYSLSIPQFLEI